MKQRAFTLLETILTSFIVSLVIMAVFELLPGSALASKRAECQLQGGCRASACLDAQMAKGFQAQVDQQLLGPLVVPSETVNSITYSPTVSIFDVAGEDPKLIKGIRVVVTWNFRNQNYVMTRETWVSTVSPI